MSNSNSNSNSLANFNHYPVMLKEVLELLSPKPNGIYVDATVGGAGHSIEIAKKLVNGKLFCFDKDPDAVKVARQRLLPFRCATVIQSNFSNLHSHLEALGIRSVDGVLFDLGVSSFQLDEPSRGFSYKTNGPLDMRMSKSGLSALELVNKFSIKQLENIIFKFGEEKFARSIVKKIASFREKQTISTTKQLAQIVKSSIPAKFKRSKNPCKKTFQAIRIFINDELNELKLGLNRCFKILNSKGRLVVLSFHSLEDKLVKHNFVKLSQGCVCSPKLPICVCKNSPKAIKLTKKPLTASEAEQIKNHRCKSAKLRAIEKI